MYLGEYKEIIDVVSKYGKPFYIRANRSADMTEQIRQITGCILTNDHRSSETGVIEYCNQRGESEKLFDIQNNDFGWSRLPTLDMNSNTVFLLITSMLKNFYLYIVKNVSEVFKNILPTTRLKRFIFRFICVSGKWTKQGRKNILKLYTDRPYERLRFAS